ncbi:MAG: RagB/SusD family nutrient uptake outer membrane protein [Paludibacteraceae bacterium]|nr:RagB/SusD family nutrient uptake outer membrane protein [Paludibacteraceae bacterium]
MKKIILSLMAGMVLFTGCDLLNNDPDDSFTKGNFFTSETNVEMYTNYFYAEWSGYGNNGSYGTFYFPTLNDNQAVTGITPWDFTTLSATDATWDASYAEIRRANILLENLEGVEMSADAMAYYQSLGRLYRAWQHFCVVRKFGDCYWVDHSLTTEDQDILYGPRQNRNDVMDKMLEDLNYAVEHMGSKNASSRTAYNVYVAQAIKAQICLFEGTYAKYHKNDKARAEKYLAEAKTAAEAIINSGEFELTPGAEGYRANYNSLELAGNKEIIMYKNYVQDILRHATQDYCCGSTPTNGMSKAAFNAYLMKDGSLPTGEDKGVLGTDGYDAGKPVIYALLEARDPRLAQQIDGYLCYVGNNRARYEGVPGQIGAAENTVTTGYGILKFDEPETPSGLRQSTTGNVTDCPLFWLAEILLTHAEACAELGETAAATTSINKLRARAGMPDLKLQGDPANNMGVSDLIWEIRRERRVELMFDNNDRYWSLIRWHQLDKLDTQMYPDQTLGAWIEKGWPIGEGLKLTNGDHGYIDLRDTYVRKFEEKHYLAPIPSSQSVLNPQIGQNPGW